MTDKRKIQIQQNKINRLESENEKLKKENEKLKHQLAFETTNTDNLDVLKRELEKSIKEHNDVVIEFRDLNNKYKQKINQVNRLILKIKKNKK